MALNPATCTHPCLLPKAPTGIEGLAEITEGGLPLGRPTLVCGSAGCGKTLMGIEFLVRSIQNFNEPGVLMTFEETGEELAANAASLGFDLKDLQARKMLRVDHAHVDRSKIEETGEYDLEGLFICLGFAVDAIGAKRVVLDTIRALFSGFPNQAVLRSKIRRLFRWLKDKGVTTVITAERGDGTLTRQGLEEYVSDCVILSDNRVIDQITTCRLHPNDTARILVRWNYCLRTGEPFGMEGRPRTGASDYRWMLGRALPSRDEHGCPVQLIGTYTDIREHKLALERIDQGQRQLRDNNEQLIRVNVDLNNFIYTASHDLKAPISNIEGLLLALLDELTPGTAQSPAIQPLPGLMQKSVNRFKQTIDHFSDVSKLQKEHGQPTEPMDLAAVVRDVCLDLDPLIQSTGARVAVAVAAAPTVYFSEKNLRSVVFNLLSNALKYRDPNRELQVRLHSRPEGEGVVLVVQDNGLGLDAANEHRLFGVFQRFHGHVEGTGIGLYMVKKMVDNAGGRITVQSEVGAGTTFSVYFLR